MAGTVYRQLDDFKEDFVVGGLGHCHVKTEIQLGLKR
jgi:hypothetical protein